MGIIYVYSVTLLIGIYLYNRGYHGFGGFKNDLSLFDRKYCQVLIKRF